MTMASPQAAVMASAQAFSELEQHGVTPASTAIVLAVSGGPDSMAMAALVHQWWRGYRQRQSLLAVVVDHGLRQDSAAEAKVVAARLTAMGIAAEIQTVTAAPPQAGRQNWARGHRYRLLWQVALRMEAVIITGHHADDQAETVQMRLERGSGLSGLGGMRLFSSLDGVAVIRPFLDWQGDDLRRHSQHLTAVDDPSNHDERFERARLRHGAADFARAGVTGDGLCRLGQAARRITDHLNRVLAPCVKTHPHGWARVEAEQLASLPAAVQIHALRHIAAGMNVAPHPPSEASAERLAAWMRSRSDGKMTLGGLEWHARGGAVWVYPEAERPPEVMTVEAGAVMYDRRWLVRLPCRGELMPLGALGCAALRRQHPEVFDGIAVPARAYWRWPVFLPLAGETARGHGAAQNVTGEPKNLAERSPEGFMALEDGAIIPHFRRIDLVVNGDQTPSLRMSWHARGGFAAHTGLTERHNP